MLRVWCGAALVLTALFATANMALSREWAAGEIGEDWQVVFTSYVVNVGLVGSIMNLDGTDIQPLIFEEIQIVNPSCSSDGGYLSFISESSLYVVSTSESDARYTGYNVNDFAHLSISDDGRLVVVSTIVSKTIVNASENRIITDAFVANGAFHRLSPNGDQIAFSSAAGDLYLVNIDGSGLMLLATRAGHPAWSPDGSMIAYISDQDGHTDIYLVDVDRAISTQLTHLPADGSNNFQPWWMPDGEQIIFLHYPHSEMSGGYIYIMNANGSNQRPLTDPPGMVTTACFLTARPTSLIANP